MIDTSVYIIIKIQTVFDKDNVVNFNPMLAKNIGLKNKYTKSSIWYS